MRSGGVDEDEVDQSFMWISTVPENTNRSAGW